MSIGLAQAQFPAAATEIAVFAAAVWRLLRLLEERQLWTLRLRISLWQHLLLVPLLAASVLVFWLNLDDLRFRIFESFPATLLLLFVVDSFLYPLWKARKFIELRWKAWTGPSRTGIPWTLVRFIGDSNDWRMLSTAADVNRHPVESYSGSGWFGHGIVADPTDLLRARESLDRETGTTWTPSATRQEGIYHPVTAGESASLLWGEHLGFQRRSSRGIISVPNSLLRTWPTMKHGLDGRGICLAYGILARNKGLEPHRLICNLNSSGSFRTFEEQSVLWPRPAKTLRGLFHSEFRRTFSLFGNSYVTAATELGLILADASFEMVEDWLDHHLEHQDLDLNNLAYELGANSEDLHRLYRGHYAAMLVSINIHRLGNLLRPEILIYDAVCRLENVPVGAWALSAQIEERRERELASLGPSVTKLIDAII